MCVGVYAFFISASLALAKSRMARLEELREEGVAGARRAVRLLQEADRFLLCAQFGRVLASLAIGLVVAVSALAAHRALFPSQPIYGLRDTWYFVVVAYIACASLVLIVAQVAKSITLRNPERVLMVSAIPLGLHCRMWGPLLGLAEDSVSRLLSVLGIRAANEREVTISTADLGEIVKSSSEAGTLRHEEREILEGVAELSDRIARDVMTPRKDIVWTRDSVSTREVLDMCRTESVSRLLVCGRELDDVRGVLLAKDLLALVGADFNDSSWQAYIRPVYRIPDTKDVKQLLTELRHKQIHFSVVLNEHGEVVGVTTLEDLVEQIVGDIFDEFDAPQHESPSVMVNGDELIVDGAVTVAELESRCGVSLPEGEYQTVGGFVHDQLGRVPLRGDAFSASGVTVMVLEVQKHRVARVSIRPAKARSQDAQSPIAVAPANGRPVKAASAR